MDRVFIALVGFALFFIVIEVYRYFDFRYQKKRDKLVEMNGVPAIGWVVFAQPWIYQKRKSVDTDAGYVYGHVVFTTDLDMPELVPTLAAWAEKFRAYRPPDQPAGNEYRVGSVLRTEIPLFCPVLLPPTITGSKRGYMVSVVLKRNHFPERRLTNLAIVHLKVLFSLDSNNDGVYHKGNAIVLEQAERSPDSTNVSPGELVSEKLGVVSPDAEPGAAPDTAR